MNYNGRYVINVTGKTEDETIANINKLLKQSVRKSDIRIERVYNRQEISGFARIYNIPNLTALELLKTKAVVGKFAIIYRYGTVKNFKSYEALQKYIVDDCIPDIVSVMIDGKPHKATKRIFIDVTKK